MTAMIALALVGVGGVAFLIRFVIALCSERRGGVCHIVHVLRTPAQQTTTPWTSPINKMPRIAVMPKQRGLLADRGYASHG